MDQHTTKQIKQQEHFEIRKQANHKIASDRTILYEQMIGPRSIDHSIYLQNFHRNKIDYAPNSAYQPFSYQVERVLPSLQFYKIKVKIAHFSLAITAAKIPQRNILANYQEKQRNGVNIYYVILNEQKLCLKSFSFRSHAMFQQIFPNVIKQWTILKICSALQCGPYISNALGFNLLIFDDCIQYATEEGRKTNGFSQMDVKNLRQQLILMHSFKIMHIDIKPQNTVFSYHFRKPVFIDFGYSEIIEETLGYKSVVKFKGTPNFCSPQMLAIMLELEGYVDLYYNDAYGLKQLLNSEKIVRPFLQLEQNQEEDSPSSAFFMLYAFQHYYSQSQVVKARQTLSFCLNINENSIKKILLFIKFTVRLLFIREIFEIDLSKYRHLVEYREIEEELKINTGKFYYKNSINQQKHEDNDNKFEIVSFIVGTGLSENFHHYLNTIINLCKLQSDNATNFVSIAFQCVSFDVKNLEVFEKKQIAQKMNSLLLDYLQVDKKRFEETEIEQSQQEEAQSLKKIKIMLQLIFQFCLKQRSNWVKKHIFDVCQQMILLSISFLQYLERLQIFASEIFTQPTGQALVMFQLLRLKDTAEIMQFQKVGNAPVLISRFNQLIMGWLSKFNQSSQNSNNREVLSIRSILDLIQKKLTNYVKYPFDLEENTLKDIQDSSVRKYIILLLVKQKIDYFVDVMSSNQILKIAQFSKSSSDLRKLDLISSIGLNMRILTGMHNFAELQEYYTYASGIINCQTICKSLNVQQKRLFYSANIDFLQNRMKTIIKAFKSSSMYEAIYCQIFSIFVIISKKKIAMNDQLLDSLFQLYELYRRQNDNKQSDSKVDDVCTYEFLNVFYSIQLEYRFYCFSYQTQHVFQNNLVRSREEELKMKELSQAQPTYKLKHIYWHFKSLFYRYHYHLFNQQLEACLQCLTVIESLLQCLHLHLILLEIIKIELQFALNLRKMELIRETIYKLYNICSKINFTSFYLIPRNVHQIFTTFIIFQTSNQPLFYSFLNELTAFFVSHPIECYFEFLISSLDKFIAFNPSRGYSLHYSKFIGNDGSKNLETNPYLLVFYVYSLRNQPTETQLKLFKMIVLNCDRLSAFAKKKILERCFGIYFDYHACKGQQQRIFIFRMVKNYINEKKRRKLFKFVNIINNRNSQKCDSLKGKLKEFRKYLA